MNDVFGRELSIRERLLVLLFKERERLMEELRTETYQPHPDTERTFTLAEQYEDASRTLMLVASDWKSAQ